MLKVGNIAAKAGERAFGYLETMRTRAGMAPDIPVHLVAGASPGTNAAGAGRHAWRRKS